MLSARPVEGEARLSYAALADLVGAAFDETRTLIPSVQQHALGAALLRAELTNTELRVRQWNHKRRETPGFADTWVGRTVERMADHAKVETRETFLVEHYRPGLTVDELRQWATRIRDAAATLEQEGKQVRYLRSTIVPADESLLCVLEAATEELVREAYARAGLRFERLSTVIPEGDHGWGADTPEYRQEGT